MKSFLLTLSLSGVLSVSSYGVIVYSGQTLVEPFNTAPPIGTFSTLGPTTAIANVGQLDAAVNTLTAVAISGAVTSVATQAAVTLFKHNSVDRDLQSRPTGNGYQVLLATLQNGTGAPLPNLDITYDYALSNQFNEEIPGFRFYYSRTGAVNSWVNVADLSLDALTTFPVFQNFSANIIFDQPIAPGANFFFLWADDNGAPGTDTGYYIDNFAIPEPSTALLVLSGVTALGFRRSRQRA